MEPRIQYAKTEDGVSIAFSTLGEGTPLVFMPAPFSHLQLDWETPENRIWYEQLAGQGLRRAAVQEAARPQQLALGIGTTSRSCSFPLLRMPLGKKMMVTAATTTAKPPSRALRCCFFHSYISDLSLRRPNSNTTAAWL